MKLGSAIAAAVAGLLLGCTADRAVVHPGARPGDHRAGGPTTVFNDTQLAYALHLRDLDHDQRGDHFVGNSFFNQNWVQSPSSTEGRDGLGPVFNARSCSGCHFRDGRGSPPEAGEPMTSMLVRLSVDGLADDGGPRPDPSYGDQLQSGAIRGVQPEGQAYVDYEEIVGEFADGTSYSLRRPSYALGELAFGPLPANVRISPRVAPAVFGLGLLEAIPEADVLALADPDDDDGDGISGRPNYPVDPTTGTPRLGRFGWKGNQPSLEAQNTGALRGDLGITTALRPGQECADPQVQCRDAPQGTQPEADDHVVDRITFYTRTLAPPARRDVDDPNVLAGRELFVEFGCAACHVPSFVTTAVVDDLPQLAAQRVWPYTDLLLHDMGDGLSDDRPDYDATGPEWRTPPLWGLGLLARVNEHTTLLHDGRARDATEAILWHGGEGQEARDRFVEASAEQREELSIFLESL
jgi:CxxC motif-containing protein (DUF1111 family)